MSAAARIRLGVDTAAPEPCGNCGAPHALNETLWLTCDACRASVAPCCARMLGELVICAGCEDPELTAERWAEELATENYELHGETV